MPDLAIILDLDGTFADTAPDLISVANEILAAMGAGPVDPHNGRIAAGQGARRIIETALQEQGRPLPQESQWPDIIARFIASYESRICRHTRLFDGMADFLHRCEQDGIPLGICTNKKDFLAEALLKALQTRHYFKSVVGANTLGRGKPDPAPLLHCILQCGGTPQRAILIGDSMADVLAARAANVPCALAAWGYLDRPASLYQADYVLKTPANIHSLIAQTAI